MDGGPLKVVLDTETTGLGGAPRHAVVQVGLAYRDPEDGQVVAWSEDCDPGAEFYADGRAAVAFSVNGFTPERLARARPAHEVARDLRARLDALAARHGPLDLRAYNAPFDRRFLEDAPWRLASGWGPCLMAEAAAVLSPGGRWLKLLRACELTSVAYPGRAHDAASDAHAALLVHEALLRRGPRPRRVPVQGAAPGRTPPLA